MFLYELAQYGIHYMGLTFDTTHDIDLGFSMSNLKKSSISGMRSPIDMEWKGYESIGCWTHYML